MAEVSKRKTKGTRKAPSKEVRKDQLEKPRFSQALQKIAERSLCVRPQDVDAYAPREIDIRIAEAFLSGAITNQQVAELISVNPATVTNALKHPVTAAWVSRTVHQSIQHRLGLVDASMLNRALTGNVPAAKLLYERYGGLAPEKKMTVSFDGGKLNFERMTDADLDALITSHKKQGDLDGAG